MKTTTNLAALALGSVAVAATLAAASRRRQPASTFNGQVVLITGGSHGLGLALAREFAHHGARLVLCARNEQELDAARNDLAKTGADVFTAVCDVTDSAQVSRLVASALEHYGRIDVLVNNAGLINVGHVDSMAIQDFEAAMDVMFWGTVHSTLAVLPHMRNRGSGRIVNITSVGGKVTIPHLMPYSCAKFACAAFSEGMHAELQGTGVSVTTVVPGLMRTGSHLNAIFRGNEPGDAGWFGLGASLPLISMSAETAARRIVNATSGRANERILGMPANLLSRFHGMFPGVTLELLGRVGRLLPHDNGRPRRGADTPILQRPWMRALTLLGRRAAVQLLQPGALSVRPE